MNRAGGENKMTNTMTTPPRKPAKPTLKPLLVLVLGIVCAATAAHARNDILHMPLNDALRSPDAMARLDPRIRLYFGTQKFGEPLQRFGTSKANKKTNFWNKSDKEGCEWVFLSALLSLQERARSMGANAVVNIVSVYKNIEFSSETEYECGAGNVAGGVALRGEMVTLR
jgi:hypothetical protein